MSVALPNIVGAGSRVVVVINGNLKFEEGYPDDSASEAVPIDARLVLDNDSLIIVNGNLTMGEFSTIYAYSDNCRVIVNGMCDCSDGILDPNTVAETDLNNIAYHEAEGENPEYFTSGDNGTKYKFNYTTNQFEADAEYFWQ